MKGTLPSLTCPNCSHKNLEDAKFCQNCGLPLARTCTECGTANEVDAKFCRNCGKSLEQPPPSTTETRLTELQKSAPEGLQEKMRASSSQIEGERKPVTILFTDIVGSTSLAEKLDPEVWKEIVSGAHRRVGEAIYRYEGTIAQLLGDGVLAFFGAPITHEDDPIRAVHAALGIQESVNHYSQELKGLIDDLQMRIGINTGTVVIGEIGTDMHMEYLAIGDAVNVAARLQSAAEPGSVVASEPCARLINTEFDLKDLGKISVKGKAEPLHAFELIGMKAEPKTRRGIEGFPTNFVGRAQDVEKLQSSLLALCDGHGQIVTVMGDAGIGKTRLLEEVKVITREDVGDRQTTHISPSTIRWLEGRALSYGGSLSYWTITQLILTDLGLSDGAPHVEIKVALRRRVSELFGEGKADEVLSYLAHFLSLKGDAHDEEHIQALDGETLKKQTLKSVSDYFGKVANEGPTVLVFEDMHWSDPSSLELLEHLLPLTDRVPLMILMLMRIERDHGSWGLRLKAETDFHHRYTDIHLHRLSERDSFALANQLLGSDELHEEIWETILARTEGNPFYLEEVIRHLMEQNLIVQDDGGWRASEELEEMGIPDTLQGVLLARIDRLEEDVRGTLQMASVIGKSFLFRILETISEAEVQLEEHLAQLQRVDLVQEKTRIPELEYIFKHALTQEAAYHSLLHERRKVFHLKVGEALEDLFADRVDEFLGLLAYHFESAGTHEKAVYYLQRAGDQARLVYANQEAIDFYQRALVILQEEEDYDQAARTLMKLGLTYHSAFDFKRSRWAYDEAFSMRQEKRLMQPTSLPSAPQPFRKVGVEPLSLDPTRIPDDESLAYIRNMFSGLVERGLEGEILPDGAQSWEISEDGRRYIFHLREDVYWSDGKQVTAEDFEYSFMRVLDPNLDADHARILFVIKNAKSFHRGEITDHKEVGIRAADPFTLEVELENPASYFLHLLANQFPIPKHVVETLGESWTDWEKIVTNGPFQPESFQQGDSIILVRNPNYHGRIFGNLQEVHIRLMDSRLPITEIRALSYEMYKTDSIDIVRLFEETHHARHQHEEEFISEHEPGLYFIGFDTNRPPFDDARVRKAFAVGLDKEKLVDEVVGVSPYPADGGLVPPGVPGHSADIGLPYDAAHARQLLAEAGYPGGEGFPSFKIVWNKELKILENIMTQWLENLNVEVTLELMKWEKIINKTRNRNLFHAGWIAIFLDPDYFLRLGVREMSPSWRNETYDRLLEEASSKLDQGERIQLYQTADKFLIEEAVVIPINYHQAHYLIKPWVKIPVGQIGDWIFKDIIIEPH